MSTCYINAETKMVKWIPPSQIWKISQVQPMSHRYINAETKKNKIPSFQIQKNSQVQLTSFRCINEETKKNEFPPFSTFKSEKFTSPANEIPSQNAETIGKWKNESRIPNLKNVQVQLMSFHYINAETTGKWKN